MNLKRLTIHRLPGIRDRFEIKAAGPGIHIIFGPNGIGKSSICRAVEGLYWQESGLWRQTLVTGEFERDGTILRAEREGSTLRWSDGEKSRAAPNLPASHNSRCFFLNLRDLVDNSPGSTDDIAADIRRQMSGGFDLDKIIEDLFSPVTHPRKRMERSKFNSASAEVERAKREQSILQQRVGELEERRARLEKADTAAARLPHVERARGFAERREELAGIEEELQAMSPALANMTGREPEDVAQHQDRLAELEKQARTRKTELRDARANREQSRLDAPLDEAHLPAWRQRADDLARIELALHAARNNLEAARNKLASALDAVGGRDIEAASLSLPGRGELFEFLRDSDSQRNRVGAIEERLRLLGSFESPETGEREFEEHRNGIEALRVWLRAPPPESPSARLRSRRYSLLLAFAMVLAGIGLAYLIAPPMAFIAAAGFGIGLAALFVGHGRGAHHQRRRAQEEYEDLGLEQPARWDVRAVASLLDSLEVRIADLDAARTRSRDRDVERKSLENQLDGLRKQASALKTRRQELQLRLGLESLPADAEMVDLARALDELRQAQGEFKAAAGKVRQQEDDHKTLLAELAGFLEQHGEPQPGDAAEARARVNNLADRNSQLMQALKDGERAKRDLDQYVAEQEKIRSAIRCIYEEAGLANGDSRGLAALLEALPGYEKLKAGHAALASKNELDRTELEQVGESVLCEQDGKSLEELHDGLDLTAREADELRGEIGRVELEMEQARGSTTVQDLIAAQEDARANLRDQRDQTLFAEAGRFLIDEVEKEYEQTRMPRVFERARNHFSDFTFHNYELRLDRAPGNPRLFAVELSGGRRRELDELSDGTRAQLLLAARIAFAEEVENGQTLPLFLDEALDQSDPQRFEAIAGSLGCIARDQQRQIFYLTSDPFDVERFRLALAKVDCGIAAEIDLGVLRTGAASVSGPRELRVAPAPGIPAPNGRTPEEYGALLGMPKFRPALGSTEQHMFYVLWDDLELLHRFLTIGIERTGQWKTVAGTPLAEKLGSSSITAVHIGSRLDLLEVFCELWKQGRGRPVDRDALADSKAVSERYLEDVVAIAKELGGDPHRLLETLAGRGDERLQGFRTRSVERLRSYLAEKEYLDGRPVFPENELRLRCLACPAANDLPDGVASECVRRWWAWSLASSVQGQQFGRG